MKGLSAAIVSALVLLTSIAGVSILYTQVSRVTTEGMGKAQGELVSVRSTPKLLAVDCLGDQGYVRLSTDEPMEGTLYYTVKDGNDELASGFATANITDVGRVYFNATMADGDEYTVLLKSKHWTLRDSCTSRRENLNTLFLPFNESSGSVATDYSGAGNDAWTDATWVNGTSDYALRFNGTTQYARINSTTDFDSQEFTLAFWALRESEDTSNILDGGSFAVTSDGNLTFSVSGGRSLRAEFPNATWKHFALTYDGATLRLYRNCTLVDSMMSSYGPALGSLLIGRGDSGYFRGAVDEVRFYSYHLPREDMPFCPLTNIQEDAYDGTWGEEGLFI